MKIISQYTPPPAQALARLKDDLNTTSQAMAELCGLAQGQQWRKYTGGAAPREVNPHMLFFMAARLELGDDGVTRILERMRKLGAQFDFIEAPRD